MEGEGASLLADDYVDSFTTCLGLGGVEACELSKPYKIQKPTLDDWIIGGLSASNLSTGVSSKPAGNIRTLFPADGALFPAETETHQAQMNAGMYARNFTHVSTLGASCVGKDDLQCQAKGLGGATRLSWQETLHSTKHESVVFENTSAGSSLTHSSIFSPSPDMRCDITRSPSTCGATPLQPSYGECSLYDYVNESSPKPYSSDTMELSECMDKDVRYVHDSMDSKAAVLAFLQVCSRPLVVDALATLNIRNRLPVIDTVDDCYPTLVKPSLRRTVAAVWVILQRACILAEECNEITLLTALWTLESVGDYRRHRASTVLCDYLHHSLGGIEKSICDRQRAARVMRQWTHEMTATQATLLKRCDWRMCMRESDIAFAVDDLTRSSKHMLLFNRNILAYYNASYSRCSKLTGVLRPAVKPLAAETSSVSDRNVLPV